MSRGIITVEEERLLSMERRADLWKAEGRIDEKQHAALDERLRGPWISRGMIASIALFILTLLAVLAAGWFADEVLPFGERFFLGVACLVFAELLVRRFRWWSTGVEQALWISGLFALILSLPGEGKPEAMLLFASAAFVAGARLRSAPLGVLGAIIVVAYLGTRGEIFDYYGYGPVPVYPDAFRAASIAAAVLAAFGGALMLRREWRRPSSEWFWTGVVVVIPAAALVASHFDEVPWSIASLAAVLAAPLGVIAIRMRHHAPLVSAIVLGGLAGADLIQAARDVQEWLLAGFGIALLVTAFAVTRVLRGRTTGIVSIPAKLTVADEGLQTAASFGVAPHETEAAPEGRAEGGGSFGGAGATGEY